MLKCAFKTAEMYSVLVTCSMQKQNRDTNRIQDKTKCDNTASPLIQHNWVWHTNRPNQPLKILKLKSDTLPYKKWVLITSLQHSLQVSVSIWLWVRESKILLQIQGYIRHIADNASTVVYICDRLLTGPHSLLALRHVRLACDLSWMETTDKSSFTFPTFYPLSFYL